MIPLAIIFAAAAGFMTLERVRPGRELPNPAGWYVRAALLNAAQLGVVVVAGLTWNRWFASADRVGMEAYLHPTFREAPEFAKACGFPEDAERKLGRMLAFRIVH